MISVYEEVQNIPPHTDYPNVENVTRPHLQGWVLSPSHPMSIFVEPDSTDEWHSLISPSEVLCAIHIILGFVWDPMGPQHCPEGSHAVWCHTRESTWPIV